MKAELNAYSRDRSAVINTILKEPGAQRETAEGGAVLTKNGRGLVRDVEYKTGDIRSRSMDYDAQDRPCKMTTVSKTQGIVTWVRQGDSDVWKSTKDGGHFEGESNIDPTTGTFGFKGHDGILHTYNTRGQKDNPNDRRTFNFDNRPIDQNQPYPNQPQPNDGQRGRGPLDLGGQFPQYDPTQGQGISPNGFRPFDPNQGRYPADQIQRPYPTDQVRPQPVDQTQVRPEVLSHADTINQAFGYQHEVVDNGKSYCQNLWRAATEGKPVVMVLGRFDDPKTQELIKQAQEARAQAIGADGKPVADFVFVDQANFDPGLPGNDDANKTIGGYANKFGPSIVVFTQQQGDGSTPTIPDKPIYHGEGTDENGQSLLGAIGDAATRQQQIGRLHLNSDSQYALLNQVERTSQPASEQTAVNKPGPITTRDILNYSANFDINGLEQRFDSIPGMNNLPPEQQMALRHRSYMRAMAEADAAFQQAIMANNVQAQQQLTQVMGRTRAMLGLASVKWSHSQASLGQDGAAAANYHSGIDYLLQAGAIDNSLYGNPDFQSALKGQDVPETFIMNGCLSGPEWYLPHDATNPAMDNAFRNYEVRRAMWLQNPQHVAYDQAKEQYIASMGEEYRDAMANEWLKDPLNAQMEAQRAQELQDPQGQLEALREQHIEKAVDSVRPKWIKRSYVPTVRRMSDGFTVR